MCLVCCVDKNLNMFVNNISRSNRSAESGRLISRYSAAMKWQNIFLPKKRYAGAVKFDVKRYAASFFLLSNENLISGHGKIV